MWEGKVKDFIPLADTYEIANRLAERYTQEEHEPPSRSLYRSWDKSLKVMADVLRGSGLDENDIILEYHLPGVSERPDVILTGRSQKTKKWTIVAIELKQ
jgi:hypothetical protein